MNIDLQFLNNILNSLRTGSLELLTQENIRRVNMIALGLLQNSKLRELFKEEILCSNIIIVISNILYNNTDKSMLVLEDGVYDIFLEMYKNYDKNFQVGAEPIKFDNITENIYDDSQDVTPLFKRIDTKKVDNFLFKDVLLERHPLTKDDFCKKLFIRHPDHLEKKTLNQKHDYPELVGTLDKCKFVLNSQAKEIGVYDDANVKVFERDFINEHIKKGILDPKRNFYLVLEEKLDGVSVEASISGDRIISARQRGDANQDLSADVTPVLMNYLFPHAYKVKDNQTFGIKFEAVMTYQDLYRYNQVKNKDYKNGRTAISSIFNSLDGWRYTEFITLIPLATSLNIDRLTEIEFLNKYYSKNGFFLRHAVIHGDYIQNLFQVKGFVEECEYMRSFLPYMIDGVVVSYIEDDLIQALGRENSINKYSVAIKFNAMEKLTTFLGWSFSIGQNGIVTPVAHYNPVEFYGTIHTKTTCHSLKRFRELKLRENDIVKVSYVNDVMPYLTKQETSQNDSNSNPIIPFIKKCPYCGNELKVSESGKSMVDDNINCPERQKKRIASMLDKLNLKDFSEAYLSRIDKYTLTDLLNLTLKDVEPLGEVNSRKFLERMNELKNLNIYDYKFVGALGFSDIAEEKWKLILHNYTIQEILSMSPEQLKDVLVNIKGVGPVTANKIATEIEFYKQDLITITQLPNIIISKGNASSKTIRFSGFRDSELEKKLIDMGYDADGNKGVTKKTDILLVPNEGHVSSKTKKAGENTQIIPVREFISDIYKYLN